MKCSATVNTVNRWLSPIISGSRRKVAAGGWKFEHASRRTRNQINACITGKGEGAGRGRASEQPPNSNEGGRRVTPVWSTVTSPDSNFPSEAWKAFMGARSPPVAPTSESATASDLSASFLGGITDTPTPKRKVMHKHKRDYTERLTSAGGANNGRSHRRKTEQHFKNFHRA